MLFLQVDNIKIKKLQLKNGIRRIQVGVDNESVVHLLTMASVLENENASLIKAIRKLLEND